MDGDVSDKSAEFSFPARSTLIPSPASSIPSFPRSPFLRGIDAWTSEIGRRKNFVDDGPPRKKLFRSKGGGGNYFWGEYDNRRAPPPYRVFDVNFAHDAISPNLICTDQVRKVYLHISVETMMTQRSSWLRWDSANSVEKCNDAIAMDR